MFDPRVARFRSANDDNLQLRRIGLNVGAVTGLDGGGGGNRHDKRIFIGRSRRKLAGLSEITFWSGIWFHLDEAKWWPGVSRIVFRISGKRGFGREVAADGEF